MADLQKLTQELLEIEELKKIKQQELRRSFMEQFPKIKSLQIFSQREASNIKNPLIIISINGERFKAVTMEGNLIDEDILHDEEKSLLVDLDLSVVEVSSIITILNSLTPSQLGIETYRPVILLPDGQINYGDQRELLRFAQEIQLRRINALENEND